MSTVPDFMKKSTARGVLAQRWDREPVKLEPFKTEPNANTRLNVDVVTRDMIDRVSEEALNTALWSLKSTPYAVQAYALNLSSNSKGFNYFMEQGLGKTKTVLADFLNRFNAGLNDCMVVVTINSMKINWRKEMESEDYPFDTHIWPDVKTVPTHLKGQVIIVNYEAVRGRACKWLMNLMVHAKPYLVFDESTCIANHNSQQGKAGVMLAGISTAVRNLAGLPNPNGPGDLYNQLRVTGAPVGSIFYAFRNRYSVMGGFKNKTCTGVKNERELAETMRGRAFFADKLTWAPTLPKRLYTSRRAEMTPAQKEAYRTMVSQLYAEVENGTVSIEQAVNKSTKLQQIAAGYIYDENREVRVIGKGENPKLDVVKDYIKHADGKTIVFAHYRPSVQHLIEAFPNAAYALSKAHMKDEELDRQTVRFNNDPACRVFIAPISVMQFGHTLVGTPTDPCTSTLYYENTYSRLARSQSQDRNHRWGAVEGEDATILYCDIICSPIDERVIEVLKGRGDMAEALLSVFKEVIHGK